MHLIGVFFCIDETIHSLRPPSGCFYKADILCSHAVEMHRTFIVYIFWHLLMLCSTYKLFGMPFGVVVDVAYCCHHQLNEEYHISNNKFSWGGKLFPLFHFFGFVYHKSFHFFSSVSFFVATFTKFCSFFIYFASLLTLKVAQFCESTTSSYHHYYFYLVTYYIIMNVKWNKVEIRTSILNWEPMRYHRHEERWVGVRCCC